MNEDLFLNLYDKKIPLTQGQLKILLKISEILEYEDSYKDYTSVRVYTLKIKNRLFKIYKFDYFLLDTMDIYSEFKQPEEIKAFDS